MPPLGIPPLRAGEVAGEYTKERLLEDFFFFFFEWKYEKITNVRFVPRLACPRSGSAWLPLIKRWALASALVRVETLWVPGSLLAVQIISLSQE